MVFMSLTFGLLFGGRVNGTLNSEQFIKAVRDHQTQEGRMFEPRRYFCQEDNLIKWNEKTYAFINQWGLKTEETIKLLIESFPDKDIQYKISE